MSEIEDRETPDPRVEHPESLIDLRRHPMLAQVFDKRVFGIERRENGDLMLYERCDEYFGMVVTCDDLRKIAAELIDIADASNS